MLFQNNFNFDNCIGRQTLLYGETNTGKTYHTAKFIDFLLDSNRFDPKEISILDFAPEFLNVKGIKIGGKILDFSNKSVECNYLSLSEEIIAPRLNSNNKQELFKNICHNYKITTQMLKLYNKQQTKVLIMNDISIYLHLGDKKFLINTINNAPTFFGNSYYGIKIKKSFSTLLSLKEKKRVEFLINHIQNSILTPK
ncbi:MAG: hypothetical protein MUP85_06940 [Candidatus Lokiarchaeota archaeon]|nr:hypothetical protein [Candidatus Lokiarchaeota archaeon]